MKFNNKIIELKSPIVKIKIYNNKDCLINLLKRFNFKNLDQDDNIYNEYIFIYININSFLITDSKLLYHSRAYKEILIDELKNILMGKYIIK